MGAGRTCGPPTLPTRPPPRRPPTRGGFHPEHAMPALLDCGTDRASLLEDRFYLGARVPRLSDEETLAAVQEFCEVRRGVRAGVGAVGTAGSGATVWVAPGLQEGCGALPAAGARRLRA